MNIPDSLPIAVLSAPDMLALGVKLTAATLTFLGVLVLLLHAQGNPSRHYLSLVGAVALTLSGLAASSVICLQALLPHAVAETTRELPRDELGLRVCLFFLTVVGCGLGRNLILSGVTKRRSTQSLATDKESWE